MKTCRFCGNRAKSYMDHDRHGWYCRNEMACFNRVFSQLERAREAMAKLRSVGGQMANVLFNLSQQSGRIVTDPYCEVARDLYKQWDAIRGGAK